MKNHFKEKGITLIALIITIIALLIIAGISIGALTADNSVIKSTNETKLKTEIREEKEILNVGIVNALGKNKKAMLIMENLRKVRRHC